MRLSQGARSLRGLKQIKAPPALTPGPLRRLASKSASWLPPPGREALLFTPGPLTTSSTVKQAALRDVGSRDAAFVERVIGGVRTGLLEMAHTSKENGYECVLVQGSGTFAVESVLGSIVPPPNAGGRLLIVSNGAYGVRMAKITTIYGIDVEVLSYPETGAATVKDILSKLLKPGKFTHVGIIHHETTAGTLNPIDAIGKAIHAFDPSLTFIVDSMSGFGAYDVDVHASHVHFLVSSANKNIEGIPGFAFALCHRDRMKAQGKNARTLSLDLLDQWSAMEGNGQFRFTPPTHALLAFHQALQEHKAEGGQAGRLARYTANFTVLRDGMKEMGFKTYLDDSIQGCIISTFLFPDDKNFKFAEFYKGLSDRGMVIYPGKLTQADCFRIGSIGQLYPRDMQNLLSAVRDVLTKMNVKLPVSQIPPPQLSLK